MVYLQHLTLAERRKFYNEFLDGESARVGADVRFDFFSMDECDLYLKSGRVNGTANWFYRPWREDETGCYVIGVRMGLPLAAEVWTLAHELAHIRLNHVVKVSRDHDHTASEQLTAQLIDGEITGAQRAALFKKEEEADREIEKILDEFRAAGVCWE